MYEFKSIIILFAASADVFGIHLVCCELSVLPASDIANSNGWPIGRTPSYLQLLDFSNTVSHSTCMLVGHRTLSQTHDVPGHIEFEHAKHQKVTIEERGRKTSTKSMIAPLRSLPVHFTYHISQENPSKRKSSRDGFNRTLQEATARVAETFQEKLNPRPKSNIPTDH